MTDLLASADTRDDIMASIKDFYCGSALYMLGNDAEGWKVHSVKSGKELPGVQVRLAKGRYRFEMVR